MVGSQIFVLITLLGGMVIGELFMMGLGVYCWGRGVYEKNRRID